MYLPIWALKCLILLVYLELALTYILIALIFAQIKFIFKNFVLKTGYINSLANEGLI